MELPPLLIPLAVLALVLLLVALSVSLTPRAGVEAGVNRGTRFFLVLLRLAIGWHFLFEGVEKFNTPSWSSEPYLREASGPLAFWFRDLAGDRLKDRLEVGPGEDFPARLGAEWDAYFDRFVSHYDLTDRQREEAEVKFKQARERTLKFLTRDTRQIKVAATMPPVLEGSFTVPQRIRLYEDKLAAARQAEEYDVPLHGTAGWARVREARAEANAIRAGLKKDVDEQTAAMRDALATVLTTEQRAQAPPVPVGGLPLAYVADWSRLDWADFLVKWSLLFIGIFLIAGLLTRTACVAGALFLLSFFLAMPPLPGLPESPRAEGHYLYVNKNIIEMLALLALATTRSGRWAGLDGLLQFFRPRSWRAPTPDGRPASEIPVVSAARPAAGPAPVSAGVRGGPSPGKPPL
jgi:uncharacterized membrane protein YphA (DoxX/SURF4 family)